MSFGTRLKEARSRAVQKAAELVQKYKTRDPFAMADALGVAVRYRDDFKTLKGMYTVIARNRFIFINANNEEWLNRVVCAHELGHDQLHRDFAKNAPMEEVALYDPSSVREYEANLFAAELLLPDDEMLAYIAKGMSGEQIAALTETDPNLVALKVKCLMAAGYTLNAQVYENRFLK
ncbi:MAG: ImmA/IrrE family metallo-endopeptidase [Ruminococcaceae bacterium]|nr:ImmA/IrrE family metallo-endopeptidase [Oscillospiraceae bacterium]